MPHVELPQAEFKVVILGDTTVGKTSLVLRFAEGYYRDEGRSATVGAFFITKRVQTSNGITCKVQIWDTAGQPQFRKMAPMYYRTAAAAIICYDVSNPESFASVREWVKELQQCNATPGTIAIVIAATKRDLMEEPAVKSLIPIAQAIKLAAEIGAIFVDTSARNNDNVHLLFQRVSERVLELREQSQINGINNDTHNEAVTMTPSNRNNPSLHGNETGNIWRGSGPASFTTLNGESRSKNESTMKKIHSDNNKNGSEYQNKSNKAMNQSKNPTSDEWEEKFREEGVGGSMCTALAPCASSDRGDDSQCTIT